MVANFNFRNGTLYCEDVKVEEIVKSVGSPAYIYSKKAILDGYKEIRDAFADAFPLVCFSVKSNSNLSILRLLAVEGSGFDVVSGGELYRALQAGAHPKKIIFAGVGKSSEEIEYALDCNILMFNVESLAELKVINALAYDKKTKATVALRLNPDVDPKTHAKTTTGKRENKFGIDLGVAERIVKEAKRYDTLQICGLHVHLGSPIMSPEPYVKALEKIKDFLLLCRENSLPIEYVNIGGGYCISYTGQPVCKSTDYAREILPLVRDLNLKLILEPGRFIVGNSGILVTKVVYKKETSFGKRFIICDAAMNDLIRPTLYDAFHRIWPVSPRVPMPEVLTSATPNPPEPDLIKVDIVGPVCESSDFFAKDRFIPEIKAGELLSIFSAGAYGFTMSSNYNSRPRPCEVLVDGKTFLLIRRRETCEDLISKEIG
ncbi:MAG TPA: diaminopimelate decarboxylase [Candidatus Hypogeohydataceae bacterium YC41]